MSTLPFSMVEKLVNRENNRLNRPKLPSLSIALSDLTADMVWEVYSVDNEMICKVDGERVDFEESE